MVIVTMRNNGSPHVRIRAFHFTQGGGKQGRAGVLRFDSLDHFFEALNLGGDSFATCFRALDSEIFPFRVFSSKIELPKGKLEQVSTFKGIK